MKYKITLIIFLSILFTTFIYYFTDKDNLNILPLGDALSRGMTPYQVEGYNYNDYLTNYLKEENKLEVVFKNFNEPDETATNLLNKIRNNEENNKIKIKQAIKEADIITISLGTEELNSYAKKNNLGSSKINSYLNKYEEILKEIRKINNKKIMIISLYKTILLNQNKIAKINENLKNLALKYQCIFIDIEDLSENNEFINSKKDIYLNYKGQEEIYKRIVHELEKSVFLII